MKKLSFILVIILYISVMSGFSQGKTLKVYRNGSAVYTEKVSLIDSIKFEEDTIPRRIYWDIAEQPEIMALAKFRSDTSFNVAFNPGDLADITWSPTTGSATQYQQLFYYCDTLPSNKSAFDSKKQYVHEDYLRLDINPNMIKWIEFKTPELIGSKNGNEYKVWLCYRRESYTNIQATFKQTGKSDQLLSKVVNLAEYMPNPNAEGSSHELIELSGWKQYCAKEYSSVVPSHLLGTIKVYSTGRHTLRIDAVTSSGPSTMFSSWDMIQFIPVEESQLYPRIDIQGNLIEQAVPACEIFPKEPCNL